MNQHTALARTPRKATKAASAKPQLRKLSQTVKKAGVAAGRVGAKAAQPLVRSIKQEEPGTLGKMALAALAPKLADAALRFVIRNPLVTAAGLVAFAVFATMDEDSASA